MRRRGIRAAAVAALVLVIAACAGLPTSGPVNVGRGTVEDDRDNDISYLPDRPAEDATPEQIVEGFLAAGSGPRGNWSVAKEFLAPGYRESWNPRAGVLVHTSGPRTPVSVDPGSVEVTVVPTATVDQNGAYSTASGGELSLEFRLEQDRDGQWRIVQAPDGIVIDEQRFATVFRGYSIMYFDPTWTYLVPDERWFPRLEAATSIAEALVGGEPSPWLADAVVSAFTETSRRTQGAVPVRQGVAEVSLDSAARGIEQTMLDRMQAQLQYSLLTAGVPSVAMMVDDQVLRATAAPVRSTRVDPRPLVLTADGFGFLSGDSLERVPGLSAAIESLDEQPVAIEVDPDRTAAAVQAADGRIARIGADDGIVPLADEGQRTAPSIDPFGFVWTVAAEAPSSVIAFAPDGESHVLADVFPGATRIDALEVSRDGTRLAVAGREGTVATLWVAGIVRDGDGVPTGIGERKVLSVLDGAALQATWLDAGTIAVLTLTSEGEWHVHEQRVGGSPIVMRAPPEAVAISSSSQTGGLRVLDAAGVLHLQRGSTWQRAATEVAVIATQQGLPQ